jgi:hypothetical protein
MNENSPVFVLLLSSWLWATLAGTVVQVPKKLAPPLPAASFFSRSKAAKKTSKR